MEGYADKTATIFFKQCQNLRTKASQYRKDVVPAGWFRSINTVELTLE